MAEDELNIEIDKAYWGKGVVRGLQPLLRELGDKHGNLVVVMQQTRGNIMLKGPSAHIEAAKPGLRALIEEHFPDAPMPEALSDGAAQDEDCCMAEEAPEPVEEKPAPAPPAAPAAKPAAPSKPAETAKPKASPPAEQAAAVPAKTLITPVPGRKLPKSSGCAAPDLLWQCIKKNSCFIKRPQRELPRFSSEPCNLTGLHNQRFSGLVSHQALDVKPVTSGIKEGIELVQSCNKASQHWQPEKRTLKTGLSKCPPRGLAQIDTEIAAKSYRPDLHDLAREKYVKVQSSFKKKKRAVKPRGSKKSAP